MNIETFWKLPASERLRLWKEWNPECPNGIHCKNHNPHGYKSNDQEALVTWIQHNQELFNSQIQNSTPKMSQEDVERILHSIDREILKIDELEQEVRLQSKNLQEINKALLEINVHMANMGTEVIEGVEESNSVITSTSEKLTNYIKELKDMKENIENTFNKEKEHILEKANYLKTQGIKYAKIYSTAIAILIAILLAWKAKNLTTTK